ncbi:hypothetical protein [Streptomyces sp. NPDC048191]|uniref:hypothetical protein n=1 Tax=Streptomyces sp. NPDC048191 TaxID=3155484 RepID=UPI00340DDCD5
MRKFLGPLLCPTAGAPALATPAHSRVPVAGTGGARRAALGAGDRLTLPPKPRRTPVALPLGDTGRPADDVPDSTTGEPGGAAARRIPAHAHTLGYDASAPGPAPRRGGDQPHSGLVSSQDGACAGAFHATASAPV